MYDEKWINKWLEKRTTWVLTAWCGWYVHHHFYCVQALNPALWEWKSRNEGNQFRWGHCPRLEVQLLIYLCLPSTRQLHPYSRSVGSGLPTQCKSEPSQLQLIFDHALCYSRDSSVTLGKFIVWKSLHLLQKWKINKTMDQGVCDKKGKDKGRANKKL